MEGWRGSEGFSGHKAILSGPAGGYVGEFIALLFELMIRDWSL